MAWAFSARSLANLQGVHPDLVRVANAALARSPLDFGIIEGVRSAARQHQLYLAGKTQLDYPGNPTGRHLTGHAVDYLAYVNGVATETDLSAYATIAQAFKAAAADLGIPVHWGGDNPHWKDEDHIELDRGTYPDAPLVA